MIGRPGTALGERLLAGFVIVLDLVEPLARGIIRQRLEQHGRTRHVVEDRVEAGVEQRQPMLHADMAPALAHRLVELVVRRRRPERLDIAEAEAPDRLGGELQLGDRDQIEGAQLIGGALGLGIEAADRFEHVAEKIEPHRLRHSGREQIDDAAAHRVVARLAHGRGAREAVELEPAGDPGHVQHIAGRDRERLRGDDIFCRHALQRRVDRGEQHGGSLASLAAGKARQRRHPLRDHACMRRGAVVRQAIPGWEFEDRQRRIEERQRARERRHARPVTADDQEARRRSFRARRHRAGEIGDDQAFGAVGDARQRERPIGGQEIGRRCRHAGAAPPPRR